MLFRSVGAASTGEAISVLTIHAKTCLVLIGIPSTGLVDAAKCLDATRAGLLGERTRARRIHDFVVQRKNLANRFWSGSECVRP